MGMPHYDGFCSVGGRKRLKEKMYIDLPLSWPFRPRVAGYRYKITHTHTDPIQIMAAACSFSLHDLNPVPDQQSSAKPHGALLSKWGYTVSCSPHSSPKTKRKRTRKERKEGTRQKTKDNDKDNDKRQRQKTDKTQRQKTKTNERRKEEEGKGKRDRKEMKEKRKEKKRGGGNGKAPPPPSPPSPHSRLPPLHPLLPPRGGNVMSYPTFVPRRKVSTTFVALVEERSDRGGPGVFPSAQLVPHLLAPRLLGTGTVARPFHTTSTYLTGAS